MPARMRIYRTFIVFLALQMLLISLISGCRSEANSASNNQSMTDAGIQPTILTGDLKIQILNSSSHSAEELIFWVNSASGQMRSRESSVLVFVYDVGQARRPQTQIPETPFNEHEILLSSNEQEFLLNGINHWLEQDSCMGKKRRLTNKEMDRYRLWIEKGADASTQIAPCPRTRVVAIALTDSLRNREPPEKVQLFFLHEMYHAFQQDLEDEGSCGSRKEKPDSNTRWMVEGGAHYFSTMLLAQMQDSKEGVNHVLQDALRISLDEGTDIFGGSTDRTGAGALQLMIERELITEESIMDGSFFHNCARELEFESKDPEIKFIRENWHRIKKENGEYSFNDIALNGNLG